MVARMLTTPKKLQVTEALDTNTVLDLCATKQVGKGLRKVYKK